MKNVLITGAGRSSSALIDYLLKYSVSNNIKVSVGDVTVDAAAQKTGNHPNARPIKFDVNDVNQRSAEVAQADVVISLLPPHLHHVLAVECLAHKKHFITASYLTPEMEKLHSQVKAAGILFLNECGLDPGIDHMSAMEVFDRLKEEGAELTAFKSYTGGLVAPESNDNPWGYKFSWNPRNVILAGSGTARYIQNGEYKYIPYNRIFTDIERIEVDGLGAFDGYANRDSLSYRHHYHIENIPTILRGTLRHAGFCRAWDVFVKLGLTDDSYTVEKSDELTYMQLIKAFLPTSIKKATLIEAVADFCRLPVDGEAMTKVIWTGIFDDEPIGLPNATPAQILQHLLEKKWLLKPGDKDMIVMQHQFEFIKNNKPGKITSSLVVKGDDELHTAMAKTVGLPLGIVTRLLLENKISLSGVHIPVMKEIYEPVLKELGEMGVSFDEHNA